MRFVAVSAVLCLLATGQFVSAEDSPRSQSVSWDRDVRPILQAHCQGCHQPAKRGGDYLLTTFSSAMVPGESGEPAVVPGDPEKSYLLQQITPHDGRAEMPKGAQPLSGAEIALIRDWIRQGAIDDSPASAVDPVDQEHPPIYTRQPLVTSIDFSPDGRWLAIAGYHEVLLRSVEDGSLAARLIGLSERIESVAFSPDGTRLAVAGGLPARQGELQVWNVSDARLELSIPVTFDTVYGASWSPDGKLVAVGCGDSAVRAFDSRTGTQVFYNAAPEDWALETVFSVDGSLLVSVGRDMSTKLYGVPAQQFIDNVTSITPGALKGGLSALARHPAKNEILVGGSDGIPRIYRMERVTKRVIGDDANLLRRFPGMPGRLYSVAYAPDGKSIVCVSSLDGRGFLRTYSADFHADYSRELTTILQTVAARQTNEMKGQIEEFVTSEIRQLTETAIDTPLYAVAWHPAGDRIAVTGGDGLIRLVQSGTGEVEREFPAVELSGTAVLTESRSVTRIPDSQQPPAGEETFPESANVAVLEVAPAEVRLDRPHGSTQLLVTARTSAGEQLDVTRLAEIRAEEDCVRISPLGRIFPAHDGTTRLTVRFGGQAVSVPVHVAHVDHPEELNFITDVNPILTRLGCNQGTCHGAKDGKNGFKLSLRGYDPIADVRSFADDLKSRRTNVASPDHSLLLLKASGVVPHVGGRLIQPGDANYETLRRWIAEGARLQPAPDRVVSIAVEPANPVIPRENRHQQLRVLATYSSGIVRDVTGEAFLDSGNTEVAEVNRSGVATTLRRGEAAILARYEGNYAATTLTVMGDRGGFVWQAPETWTPIDELVAAKWERMKIAPSSLCPDSDFLRRVFLDLTGLPPTVDDVLAFQQDPRPSRIKREAMIDQLIGSEAYIDFWTNKWADLLQVNSKFLGEEGAAGFRNWIRDQVAANVPYDQFCREILTATGSNKRHPEASYFKILRTPDMTMENTTQLFLAIRFNCNKCHDHPFERWTQDQYYETAAYFARLSLQRDPDNAKGKLKGTAVEAALPLWEVVSDTDSGEIRHDRTGLETAPRFPFDRDLPTGENSSRREQLAQWLTSSENDYFASSYVNRVFGYLMGTGLIEPLDDIRAGNPPSNPELLRYLTESFVKSGFNTRELMRSICKSRVYQLDVATNSWNEDDRINYSHFRPKRLPAEVLYDTVYAVTGSTMKIPGVPEGTRAAALPDVAINLEDGFLDNLGRPARESACECERSFDLQLGPVMALMNGPTVSQAISHDGNALDQIVRDFVDPTEMVNQIFLRILNRPAREPEIAAVLTLLQQLQAEHVELKQQLQDYQTRNADRLAEREAEWKAALDDARQQLAEYEPAAKAEHDAAEAERNQKIETAGKNLDEFQANLQQLCLDWEKSLPKSQTPWVALKFSEMRSSDIFKIIQQDDLSLLTSGQASQPDEYVLRGIAPLQKITAIKLEALTDPSLPNYGPGLGRKGEFVITELVASVINEQGQPGKPLALTNPRATYSEPEYDVSTAIDGSLDRTSNGWGVLRKTGVSQSATFELAEPLILPANATLLIALNQNHEETLNRIGRFRISVTSEATPVNEGQPAQILDLLAITPDSRTPEQQEVLCRYFRDSSPKFLKLTRAVEFAKRPLPEDAKLATLKALVALRERPFEDPQLERLKRAVRLSEQQLKSDRLTAAQDLAWALINSPAFLFNH